MENKFQCICGRPTLCATIGVSERTERVLKFISELKR